MTATAHATSMTLKATHEGGTFEWKASRDQELIDLYSKGANLAAIAGVYVEDPDFSGDLGGEAEFTATGVINYEADVPNCTMTGTLSTINAAFNEYAVAFNASGCQAYLDYTTYTGYGFQYSNSGRDGLFLTAVSGNGAVWMIGLKTP